MKSKNKIRKKVNPSKSEAEKRDALRGQDAHILTQEPIFSDDEVLQLRSLADRDAKPAVVAGSDGKPVNISENRRSETTWINRKEYPWVYNKLASVIRIANETYNYDIYKPDNPVQIAVYQAYRSYR